MTEKILPLLRNKYIAIGLAFFFWMLFFNDIDIPFMIKSRSKLSDLRKESEQIRQANEIARESYLDLTTNKGTLEKFARERYFMKKPNEDLYVIRTAIKNEN